MEIRPARPADLPAAARLLATSLRFSPADAVPAWFMRTTDECGGLTLVAVDGEAVVGVSYAFPGAAGVLYSCGLAVAPAYRGRRLGVELKLEQRRLALEAGYGSIRWTADPVNGRALRVYLTRLGALVTGYRTGLHDGLRADPGHPQDDVDVVWPLADAPELDERGAQRVMLPWAGRVTLAERRRVREEMGELLSGGFVGSGVGLDRATRRCWVSFQRRSP